jgi:diguanylate cyclase (GGDEF)-like protein
MKQQTLILLLIIWIIISILSIIIINLREKIKLQQKEIEHLEKWHSLALTDNLTQINNRVAYSRHIKKLHEMQERAVGIVLFDIDDFKKVNDVKGHLEGDRILQKAAQQLTMIFCEKEFFVYRIGGDEFAVICENTTEAKIIDRLLKLRETEKYSDFRFSKGYCMVDSMQNFEKAFDTADKMLYADKESKKC